MLAGQQKGHYRRVELASGGSRAAVANIAVLARLTLMGSFGRQLTGARAAVNNADDDYPTTPTTPTNTCSYAGHGPSSQQGGI